MCFSFYRIMRNNIYIERKKTVGNIKIIRYKSDFCVKYLYLHIKSYD